MWFVCLFCGILSGICQSENKQTVDRWLDSYKILLCWNWVLISHTVLYLSSHCIGGLTLGSVSWLIQCLACSGDAVLTAVTFSLHIPVIDKIISYAILCKRHLHIHTTNTSGECLVLSCWSQSCFDSYTKAQSFVFICGQPSATGSL